MPAGRPKIEIDIAEVERLASQGLTQQQIADSLGISRITLQRNKANSDTFAAAIKRGQAKGIDKVTNALFQQAVYEGSVAAAIFYLKNRAEWKDAKSIEGKLAVTEESEPVSETVSWLEGMFGGDAQEKDPRTRTH